MSTVPEGASASLVGSRAWEGSKDVVPLKIVEAGLLIRPCTSKVTQAFPYGRLLSKEDSLPVEWKYLTCDTDFEGENIYVHEIVGNDQLHFLQSQEFKESYCNAIILINSSDEYQLSSEIFCNFQPIFPTVVVTKADGCKIISLLEKHRQMEAMFINSLLRSSVISSVQREKMNLPKQEAQTEEEELPGNLKDEISRWMFSVNRKAIVVSENKDNFCRILMMFDSYVELKRNNEVGLNSVLQLLKEHSKQVLVKDFPFYVVLANNLLGSTEFWGKKIEQFVYYYVEELGNPRNGSSIAQVLNEFMQRGDFGVKLTTSRIDSVFNNIQFASLSLTSLVYQMKIKDSRSLMKCLWKNFVYSRMLWISVSIKARIQIQNVAQCMGEIWKLHFQNYHHLVDLSIDTITEIQKGLKFGAQLELPTILSCSSIYLQCFLGTCNVNNTPRKIEQLRNCFVILKEYIMEDEVAPMLIYFRNIYYKYFQENQQRERLSCATDKNTLSAFIEHGIDFLDTVYQLYDKLPTGVDVALQEWFKLLLDEVVVTGADAGYHFNLFRGNRDVLKKYKPWIKTEIVSSTKANFKRLSFDQFYHIHSYLLFKSLVVEEFLKVYDIDGDVCLCDPTWELFFDKEVQRYSNAKNHNYLSSFIKDCSNKYLERNEAEKFILDLLKINVRKLLYASDNDCESQEIRHDFSAFLFDFTNDKIVAELLQHHQELRKFLSPEKNEFQELIILVLCQVIVPELHDKNEANLNLDFKYLMVDVADILMVHNWQYKCSALLLFAWGMLASSCSKIIINAGSLNWIDKYGSLIECLHLDYAFASYCNNNGLSNETRVIQFCEDKNLSEFIHFCNDKGNTHLSEYVKGYFEWISRIQKEIQDWKLKFKKRDVTIGEIETYEKIYIKLGNLSARFFVQDLLFDLQNVKVYKKSFLNKEGELDAFLLKHINDAQFGHQSCLLSIVLSGYHVLMPEKVVKFISQHVSLPEFGVIPYASNDEHQKFSDFTQADHITLNKSTTLVKLFEVVNSLDAFQRPFLDCVDMLLFFKLNISVLFEKHVHLHLERLESNQIDSQSLVCNFSEALERTKDSLSDIISGDASYFDIVTSDEGYVQGLDVDTEFEVLRKYAEHFKIRCDKWEGTQSMLEIVQYTSHIENICSVCHQYMKQCLEDRSLQKLSKIRDHFNERSNIRKDIAKKTVREIRELLFFKEKPKTSSKCLDIFASITNSEDFYKFVQANKFYGKEGQDLFYQQYDLITAQLQHEEYEEYVLNHLKVAYKYMTIFMDHRTSFKGLMERVIELDIAYGFEVLDTVNSNITLISLWFSRAEGDTVENVAKELECIMETGGYVFVLGLSSAFKDDCFEGKKSQICLKYVAHSQLHQKNSDKSSLNNNVEKPALKNIRAKHSQCLNNEQINEFLRKLGFIDKEKKEGDHCIKQFLYLSQIAYKLLNLYQRLKDLGHPEYISKKEIGPFKCSQDEFQVDKQVRCEEQRLDNWVVEISKLQKKNTWLLYFNMPKLMQLHNYLQHFEDIDAESRINAILNEINFLVGRNIEGRQQIHSQITKVLECSAASALKDSAISKVGNFLQSLLQNQSISYSSFNPKLMTYEGHSNARYLSHQLLYSCHEFLLGDLQNLILHIFPDIPQTFQILRCQSTTTLDELSLFLTRVETISGHYVVLQINKLSFKLEHILQQRIVKHKSSHEQLEPSDHTKIIFIETGPSEIRHVPWIPIINFKKETVSLEEVKHICKDKSAASKHGQVQLVYGLAGNGKTHYIRSQLRTCSVKINIAINEDFSPGKIIFKLRSQYQMKGDVGIFFNFTILPPVESSSECEKIRHRELIEDTGWFFFDLLVLGSVEDSNSGLSFALPAGLQWDIYIEVPHTKSTAEESLELFCKEIPVFKLVENRKHITYEIPYTIDPDVQLVCKYLNAYECREDARRGIDKLYLFDICPPVKFSEDNDLLESTCQELLDKYGKIAESKVLKKLYIRYMLRRCQILDSLPAFNYNQGYGEIVLPEYGRIGPRKITNTTNLGSTLMTTMLDEVNHLCTSSLKKEWSKNSHNQLSPLTNSITYCNVLQLIYDFKDGGSSIGLISLKPDNLHGDKRSKFEEIGIVIPSTIELYSRKVLDRYLSRALDLELHNGKLALIDNSKYVLTLDYAVKMLDIHERLQCGIPVVIEGETGVGKTALVEMLSKLWNQSLFLEWTKQKSRLLDYFKEKLGNLASDGVTKDYQACINSLQFSKTEVMDGSATNSAEKSILGLCQYLGGSATPFNANILEYLCLMRNDSIIGLLKLPDNQSASLDELFDTAASEKTPKATSCLFHAILTAFVSSSFHKVNVHAAMTPADVRKQMKPVLNQANKMLQIYEQMLQRSTVKSVETNKDSVAKVPSIIPCLFRKPHVTLFLDEINTSSCPGLFKEMIVDRTIDGKPIPDNIFIVAACNPHRGNSLATHQAWLRGTYNVRPLHPTLKLLMWDYGALDKHQERDYVNAKMKMINIDMNEVDVGRHTTLIVNSQTMMRDFALEQLVKEKNISLVEASISACSCVSQRDIQRVFTFYEWFRKLYRRDKKLMNRKNNHQRAVLVSLGLVYYLRLNDLYRKKYADNLKKKTKYDISFQDAFNEELDYFISKINLPNGIAKTLALKENIFAIIVCTVNRTPLIIVGAPGSSKTLSFNLAVSNLKGQESKQHFFSETDFFKALDPHYYQCSRRTTSNEIKTVFKRATNRQHYFDDHNQPTYCVVFMDEAGLPEESHESLKVLHYFLDIQEVSFVAITNHILDAAKTNRAISLFRPDASKEDLEVLAKGCLCPNPEHPPINMKDALQYVVQLCHPYSKLMENTQFSDFFGLRDFIHFISYIRRKSDVTKKFAQLVIEGLERNFNGYNDFLNNCNAFLFEINSSLENVSQRKALIAFQDSLRDTPKQYNAENEVRYKLLIDSSDDDSLVRTLYSVGILNRNNTRMFMCSNFPEDGELQKIDTIAAIRHSAMKGHTVILSQTDDIHESFYDLFNQRFRRIDHNKEPRYYANIAIGAYHKPSRVNHKFQCVVVIKKSEIHKHPSPFLNRFEKYSITHKDILDVVYSKLPKYLAFLISTAKEKVKIFIRIVGGNKSLYGLQPVKSSINPQFGQSSTLDSLILDLLPPSSHKLCQARCEDDIDSSEPVTFILDETIKILRSSAGFKIPEISKEELKEDKRHILELMNENCKFKELLQKITINEAKQYIHEAFGFLLYSQQSMKTGGCLILSFVQQVIICILIKRILQLMTCEGIILNRTKIPAFYLDHYLRFQSHFSLKRVIKKYLQYCPSNQIRTCESPNKLILFSRSSPLINAMPGKFPFVAADTLDNNHVMKIIQDLIFEQTDKVMINKLSYLSSQSAVQQLLRNFVLSEKAKVFLILADMNIISMKIINHTRVMIEEAEIEVARPNQDIPKLFVLLLHFPPALFFDHCYPTLFLKGWDHIYLDTIAHSPSGSMIGMENWFKNCFYFSADCNYSAGSSEYHDQLEKTQHILPLAIPVLSARIQFGRKNDKSFNSIMSATQRGEAIKMLLHEHGIGRLLCEKFSNYWEPKVKLEYLQRAAKFSQQRQSTLNITESINTTFKALFLDFCVYMMTFANENHNLDIVFAEDVNSDVHALFMTIFKDIPMPKLSHLNMLSKHFVPTEQFFCKLSFPFFSFVCKQLEELVEHCAKSTNLANDMLQDSDVLHQSDILRSSVRGDPAIKMDLLVMTVLHSINSLKEKTKEDVVSTILFYVDHHKDIWNRYFNDFISYKLKDDNENDKDSCQISAIDIRHRLLDIFFKQLNKLEPQDRVIHLHCHVQIYHINLAQLADMLRPLYKVQELHLRLKKLSASEDNSSAIVLKSENRLMLTVSQNYPVLGSPEHISDFVIAALFEALRNSTITSHDNLMVWFSSYCGVMALPSLKEYIYMCSPKATPEAKEWSKWEAKLNVMQVTCLSIAAFPALNDDALLKGKEIFELLFKKYFTSDSEILRPGLAEVAQILADSSSVSHFRKKVMEGLLSHYFSSYLHDYNKDDVKWFLEQANCQTHWKTVIATRKATSIDVKDDDVVEHDVKQTEYSLMNTISKCKLILAQILGENDEQDISEDDEEFDTVLLFYRKDMRKLVGSVLCPENGTKGSPGTYIPWYYQPNVNSLNALMQQPLCHLYFVTIVEHFHSDSKYRNCQPVELIDIINKLKSNMKDAKAENAVLLWIEMEAVTQFLIEKIANSLNPSREQGLGDIHSILHKINGILEDRGKTTGSLIGHGQVLSFHLLKILKSSRKLADYLSKDYNSLKMINCLGNIREELKPVIGFQPHLLPFIDDEKTGRFSKLYTEICDVMMGIHHGNKKVEDLVAIAQKCSDKEFGKPAVIEEHEECEIVEEIEGHQVEEVFVELTLDTDSTSSGTDTSESEGNESTDRQDGLYDDTNGYVFRMLVWFVIYYEFYNNKEPSVILRDIVQDKSLFQYFKDKSYINLFQCFLDPMMMIRKNEHPIPRTEQDILKLHQEGMSHTLQSSQAEPNDPIYSLFMPDSDSPDNQSNADLRHAVANMVGIVLGTAPQCNHLWNHLFAGEKLEGTYMTGFMYGGVTMKMDGLQYDSGVELSSNGIFGRLEYMDFACRGTYSLHSLYLLLWANFGAFCISLLTQPNADECIHGSIISKNISLRSYCLHQLQLLWLLIRNCLNLSDEGRSFFIKEVLWNFYEVLPSNMPEEEVHKDRGLVFNTLEELNAYEKMWHNDVCLPVWEVHTEKFKELCKEDGCASLRILELHYPQYPTMDEFISYLQRIGDLSIQCKGGTLYVLSRFVMNWPRLQIGGNLLPDMIEFYCWLHSNLAHTISINMASKYKISNVIRKARNRSSKEFSKHLSDLYHKVKENYNRYIELIGGFLSPGSGDNRLKKINLPAMNDDTVLIHLLSDESDENKGRDLLYRVIADIIFCHNQTIESFYSILPTNLATFFPNNPTVIHPTEVRCSTAIFTNFQRKHELHGIPYLLQLIRSHYQPRSNLQENMAVFDLEELQEDIFKEFIAGRPLISSPSLLRTVFKFKRSKHETETHALKLPLTATDLGHMGDLLPEEFKKALPDDQLKLLEYEYHSADYHLLNEVIIGLNIVMDYINKELKEQPENSVSNLQDLSVNRFLLHLYGDIKDDENILKDVGIQDLKPSQSQCLCKLPLVSTFCCLKVFVEWVEDGRYDFCMVPLSFKQRMVPDDVLKLESIAYSKKWKDAKITLMDELELLIEVLKHSERDMLKRSKECSLVSIKEILEAHRLSEDITNFLSDTITLEHYVALRLTLLKLKLKVGKEIEAEEQKQEMSDIWYDDAMKAWEKDLPQMFTVPRHSLQQSVPAQGNNKENSLIFSDEEESEEDLLEDSKSDEVKKKAKNGDIVISSTTDIVISPTPVPPTPVPRKKKKNKNQMAEWLENEGIDEQDVKLFKERGINEVLFLKLKSGDKKLEGISEATVEQLQDLQKALGGN